MLAANAHAHDNVHFNVNANVNVNFNVNFNVNVYKCTVCTGGSFVATLQLIRGSGRKLSRCSVSRV
jgi:hypothetical protein